MALVPPSMTVDCFTCLKKLGEKRRMEEIHPGVFFCGYCKNVKQLDDRMALHPAALLSMASLPLLNIATATSIYLLNHMPLALQIAMGGLLFTGYLLKGLKTLGR